MANTKITALTALTSAASGDYLTIVDVSDTSMASSGTNKKITVDNLMNYLRVTANTWTALQTFSQGATVGTPTSAKALNIDGPAGSTRQILFLSGGSLRWSFREVNAETGSNSGSDLAFVSRDDSGGYLATVLQLMRSNGHILIGTATDGGSILRISGLPTSSTGLSSGDVWNDGGVLKIV